METDLTLWGLFFMFFISLVWLTIGWRLAKIEKQIKALTLTSKRKQSDKENDSPSNTGQSFDPNSINLVNDNGNTEEPKKY